MSAAYWENRYREGGNSGSGSRGDNAIFKAEFLNSFVKEHGVRSVVEFGCGDGYQLGLAEYPNYLGLDVSEMAIEMCREKFDGDPTKRFHRGITSVRGWELALSLDVIYHLFEDDVFESYMDDLFGASRKWVILYTTDLSRREPGEVTGYHVKHRPVLEYVRRGFPRWALLQTKLNPAPELEGSDFYVYGAIA